MSERLAGEIIHVGLLDSLCRQREALPGDDFPLSTIDLLRAQRLAHVRLLERAIRVLGGESARPSPGARRLAQSSECLQRIVHGSGNFSSSLDAILISGLRSVQGWEELVPAAENYIGFLAWEFRGALLEDRDQVCVIREWLSRAPAESRRVPA